MISSGQTTKLLNAGLILIIALSAGWFDPRLAFAKIDLDNYKNSVPLTPLIPDSLYMEKTKPGNGASDQAVRTILRWDDSQIWSGSHYEYCLDTIDNDSCDSRWVSAGASFAAEVTLSYKTTYYWQVRRVYNFVFGDGSVTEPPYQGWWEFTTGQRGIIFYVDVNATGQNDCSAWVNACVDLQTALTLAGNGDQIWVADGIYQPGEARTDSFHLPDGIEIYGGFNGTETSILDRDWKSNLTILNGDIDHNDCPDPVGCITTQQAFLMGNNSYHVVIVDNTYTTTLLDGFMINAGKANGTTGNKGGGMLVTGYGIIARNILFLTNLASEGGAMAIIGTNTTVSLSGIEIKHSLATNGGGILVENALAIINSSAIYDNESSGTGAAILQRNANVGGLFLTNSTLACHLMFSSYAVTDQTSGRVFITNSFFASNVQDMSLQPGSMTSNNIYFGNVDCANHNLHTVPPHAVIDSGRNFFVPEWSKLDLDGNPRIVNSVDIGAYEHQSILRVDGDAPGSTHNGSSWQTAYLTLQDALATASNGNEIWVAEGIYKPGTARADTFYLESGVEIYGGFIGNETQRDQRDWQANITVLSGDVDHNDATNSDGVVTDPANIVGSNAYHVLVGIDVDNTSVLDGFTITAGKADSGTENAVGGGIKLANSSPLIRHVIFTGNYALTGGGLSAYNSSPLIINCAFIKNIVPSGMGGGGLYYNESSMGKVVNTTIWNSQGCAMTLNYSSSPEITNSIIWGYSNCAIGYPIRKVNASAPVYKNSDIQTCGGSGAGWQSLCGIDGGSNIDSDPLFINTTDRNLRLQTSSPAKNSGLNSIVLLLGLIDDLDGNPRVASAGVDMGAYEWPSLGLFGKLSPDNDTLGQALEPTLNWNTANGVVSYQYCIDTTLDADCDTGWQDVGANAGAVLSNLDNGKTYSWQVRATANGGYVYSDDTAWWTFMTEFSIFLPAIIRLP